jgi:hypothetical protein
MLIEIHMIQNHSPANLNRDDVGAPKSCIFGGVMRNRVSSQALKRAIRNPGNPDDIHNREPGYFAEQMSAYLGTRTKFFPWLVQKALENSSIPQEERPRIILKAERIAVSKDKEPSKKKTKKDQDTRPKTPQLIHLGTGEANAFVATLGELRGKQKDQYDYFLDPRVGFQEMVREKLDESSWNPKDINRVVRASWVIAKVRMSELLKSGIDDEIEEPSLDDDEQPGMDYADFIAKHLEALKSPDEARFKELTRPASKAEKAQLKGDAPKKPKDMDSFTEQIRQSLQGRSVDIALFGRMTTSDAFADVAAAMQVAHAISTHKVMNEVDYFTAMDDLSKGGAAAAHVGSSQFVSPCLYKYFSLDWDQLVHNLAGPEPKDPAAKKAWLEAIPSVKKLAAATLGHFLLATARTSPSGKQNSHASHHEPSGIMVEIKSRKTPTSYANAFAEPAERIGKPQDDTMDDVSLIGRSIAQFGDHVFSMRASNGDSKLFWYAQPLWRYPLRGWEREGDGKKSKAVSLTEQCFSTLDALVEAIMQAIDFNWKEVKDVGKGASSCQPE